MSQPDTSPPSNPPSEHLQRDSTLHELRLECPPHRWIFRWQDGDEHEMTAHIRRLAEDPRVDFDREEAELICHHVLNGPVESFGSHLGPDSGPPF